MQRDKERLLLEKFGRILIADVRDNTISKFEKTIDGKLKGVCGEYYKELLAHFNDSDREIISLIARDIVDNTLHNFLWMFEQSDQIQISILNDQGEFEDLVDISDGLTGELYAEGGWISKFSKEKENLVNELLKKDSGYEEAAPDSDQTIYTNENS